jgi:acetyl esterase/lipase
MNAPAISQPATVYRTEVDVVYRQGPDLPDEVRRQCVLDLYHPDDGTGFATVVWLHGGGLTTGGRSIPLALRGQGLAVVGVDYRLHPQVKAQVSIEDAAAAVAWTVRHINRFGGDPGKVFVCGHSAGGYLAAMIGLDKRWLATHQLDADTLAGIVPLSCQAITHQAVRRERGIAQTQPVIDEFAPLHHVRPDAPPLLLVTGDRNLELLARYEENAYFWRMLKLVGHRDVELVELPGFNHGAMLEPALPLLVAFVRQRAGTSR